MVRNRKGWLRIVEASIAIMIVLSFVMVLYFNQTKTNVDEISTKLKPFLEEIATNSSLRAKIINYSINYENMSESEKDPQNNLTLNEIKSFLSSRITRRSLGYDVQICKPEQMCELYPYPLNSGNIYSSERIIGAYVTEQDFSPRKMKIYVWEIK